MKKCLRLSIIIAAICGVSVMAAGAYFLLQAYNVEKTAAVESGSLHVVEAPKDTLFGVDVQTPLLIRKVEMYQYCFVSEKTGTHTDANGNEAADYKQYVREGFSEREYGSEKAYDNSQFKGEQKWYENPVFPEGLKEKGEWLYGETEIGTNGVRLAKRQVEKFKKGGYMIDVPMEYLPKESGSGYGLERIGDGIYTNGDPDEPQIGDLRVTFRMVDPEMLGQSNTAVGKLSEENGHRYIGEDFEGLTLMGNLTREEAIERYKEENYDDGSLLFGLGIGLFAVAFLFSVAFHAATGQIRREREEKKQWEEENGVI